MQVKIGNKKLFVDASHHKVSDFRMLNLLWVVSNFEEEYVRFQSKLVQADETSFALSNRIWRL